MLLFLIFLINLDIGGYIDNRPMFGIADAVIFSGYARGWIDLKTNHEIYGAYTAIDIMLPYDSTMTFQRNTIEISRLAAWIGPYNLRAIIGKQLINWGTSRVFKCLDFFNQVNYFEPGYERYGINSLQGLWSFSSRGSLRFLVQPSSTFDQSLYASRLASNILKNDLSLNVYYQKQPELIAAGIDLAGELTVGYWAEAAYWQNDTADFHKLSFGIDYTLPLSIYVMAEYFHDISGQFDPAQYDFNLIYDGLRSTLARDYLYFNAGITPNMFFRPGISTIVNLNDRSLIIIPNIFYALFDNADLNIGAYLTFGDATSEFKNINPYDTVIYSWLKIYF